jgi:hypothetical protein
VVRRTTQNNYQLTLSIFHVANDAFGQSEFHNSYNLDEYVDLDGERSSILVEDLMHGEKKIFYNQFDSENSPARLLVMYEPAHKVCTSQSIGFWQFNEIRRISIYMSDLNALTKELIDIAIGPSNLLYAIDANAGKFSYVGLAYNKVRLSQVHVYHYGMAFFGLANKRQWLNIIVHVPKGANSRHEPQVGDPLSGYIDSAAAGAASIAVVGACVGYVSDDDEHVPEMEMKKKGAQIDPNKLDEDEFCPEDKLLFSIRYNVISEHHPGSLTGKSLAQMGHGHEFHREPFVKPIGIGCWPPDAPARQLAVANQFSGLYVSKRGYRGLSFVAYDEAYNLLRLDEYGRKNVFDLTAKKSYHMGEFAAAGPTGTLFDRPDDLAAGADNNKCVVLDIVREQAYDPLSDEHLSLFDSVIGLSSNLAGEYYLGTRVIDHVAYEVFERSIERQDGIFRVPIILRSRKRFKKNADPAIKMFATYYVTLAPADQVGAATTKPMALIKYIELWAFHATEKRKFLLNRIHFVQFSWSLDVEPADDVESQTNGMGVGGPLFSVWPCYRSRASQADLVVDYRRERAQLEAANRKLSVQQQVSLLLANQRAITDRLAHVLTRRLEVSRLNVVGLNVQILPRGDLIVSSRIADLRDGLLEAQPLGLLDTNNKRILFNWNECVRQTHSSVHSLRECQLHSIARRDKHWVAFCRAEAKCLILRPEEALKKILVAPAANETTTAGGVATDEGGVCAVYSIRYSTLDSNVGRMSAPTRADVNAWSLARETFSISLGYLKSGKLEQFQYEATPTIRHLRALDSLGGALMNDVAFLNGLRHTTSEDVDEASAGINANKRISLASAAHDPFRHCQLACQMDDHCASFSICSPAKSASLASGKAETRPAGGETAMGGADCVLSSLRLTRDRFTELIEGGGQQSNGSNKRDRYEIRVTNECESQSFVMVRQDSCSLHPRDFLADYQHKRATPAAAADQLDPIGGGQAAPIWKGCELTAQNENLRVSLDGCAGLSFERFAYSNRRNTNFIYCPLESRCVLPSVSTGAPLPEQDYSMCFMYTRDIRTIYMTKRFTEMRISPKEEPSFTATTMRPAAASDEAGRAGAPIDGVSRHLWGLDAADCARECNLYRSKCFAFDSCQFGRHKLCRLYSVRSPADKSGAYFPATKTETRSQGLCLVQLTGSNSCSHHHLRPAYFEVRLRQMLDTERMPADSSTLSANERRLNELEEFTSSLDAESSKQELATIEQELEQAKRRIDDAEHRAAAAQGHASSGVHYSLLLAGLLLGGLGAVFKDELARRMPAGWSWPGQRDQHDDTSELVAADQTELGLYGGH